MYRREGLGELDVQAGGKAAGKSGDREGEPGQKEYEQAKNDLAVFLNTPYSMLVKDTQPDQTQSKIGNDGLDVEGKKVYESLDLISKELEEKLKKFILAAKKIGQEKPAAGHIFALLKNDKRDGSNMPAVYGYGRNSGKDAVKIYEDFGEDVVTRSYRTLFYTSLIEVATNLSESNRNGFLLNCLEWIDQVIKQMNDAEQDNQYGQFGQTQKTEDGFGEDWQFVQTVSKENPSSISGDYDYTSFYDPVGYENTEFGQPQHKALEMLANGQEANERAIKYAVDFLDFPIEAADNFSSICKILGKDSARSAKLLLEIIQKSDRPKKVALATKIL
ncbi:MAG: hypothetical protein HY983_02675 [Candidatus Magasanikbacteria bacterium]|nr:hypothetical protein [Candidatus Magasanikbacteria bacterium]